MARHNALGKFGEGLAVELLKRSGYEILETNWVSGKAEIDILALKENVLAVVEVKTRSSVAFGLPQVFVGPKKIRLLLSCVNAYMEKRALDVSVRFDIIAVDMEGGKPQVEHLEDAFYYF